jgi:acetyl esterase/lipase
MTNTLRQRKSPKKKSALPTRLALKHWHGNVLTALAAGSVLLSSAAPATEKAQAGAGPSSPASATEKPRGLAAAPRAPEGARLECDLEYACVGEKKRLLDPYLPEKATGPLPVIVWVHGGGWKSGSKDQCLLARLGFPQRGYAVASVG